MLSFTSYDAYMVMYDVSEPKTETYALEVDFLDLFRFVLFRLNSDPSGLIYFPASEWCLQRLFCFYMANSDLF